MFIEKLGVGLFLNGTGNFFITYVYIDLWVTDTCNADFSQGSFCRRHDTYVIKIIIDVLIESLNFYEKFAGI